MKQYDEDLLDAMLVLAMQGVEIRIMPAEGEHRIRVGMRKDESGFCYELSENAVDSFRFALAVSLAEWDV